MAAAKGYAMKAGPEAEFFLFQTKNGVADHRDARRGQLLRPEPGGSWARTSAARSSWRSRRWASTSRRRTTRWRPGQHEIDFRYDDVLTTADSISTFRFVVKNIAIQNGLHATFMPKPIYGINGSGMHTHMSLFSGGTNIFYDAKARVAAERDVPELHRRHPAPRERLLRDHQPAGELVQAAGARLRGADQHRVVGEEPQPAGARARRARHRRRASSCACRIRRAIRISRWR